MTDHQRFVGIDGTAGTGKTYLLEKTLPHLKAMGYEIIGIAPSHKALSGLKSANVFDKTLTTQAFEKSPHGHSKAVLIMDEASMVGNKTMRAILNFSNAKNMARVALIGDPEQLAAIEAGRPFADMLEGGLRSVHMDDIIRQKDQRHRKGIKQLSKGQIAQAFQTLDKEIHEAGPDNLIKRALAVRDTMDDPSILVSTNKERELINEAIKNGKDNTGPGVRLNTWHTVHLKQAEKKLVESYERATHIRFNRDVGRGFKRGVTYKIDKIESDKARLILSSDGKRKTFTPARHGSGDSFTQALQQSQITLHEGDRIKFKTTDKKLGISNNDFAKVQTLTDSYIQIKMDNNKTVNLYRNQKILSHIDYGWANTVHSFQGTTVKDNIAIMRADHNPLNTLEALYVGASRHKEKLAIITDNKVQLLNTISEKLDIAKEKIDFKEPRRMRVINAHSVKENTRENPQSERAETPNIDKHRGDRGR